MLCLEKSNVFGDVTFGRSFLHSMLCLYISLLHGCISLYRKRMDLAGAEDAAAFAICAEAERAAQGPIRIQG
jgi:hypothetical protein